MNLNLNELIATGLPDRPGMVGPRSGPASDLGQNIDAPILDGKLLPDHLPFGVGLISPAGMKAALENFRRLVLGLPFGQSDLDEGHAPVPETPHTLTVEELMDWLRELINHGHPAERMDVAVGYGFAELPIKELKTVWHRPGGRLWARLSVVYVEEKAHRVAFSWHNTTDRTVAYMGVREVLSSPHCTDWRVGLPGVAEPEPIHEAAPPPMLELET